MTLTTMAFYNPKPFSLIPTNSPALSLPDILVTVTATITEKTRE
jgi:hypothetical protein